MSSASAVDAVTIAVHEGEIEVERDDPVADTGDAVRSPPLLGDQGALGRLDGVGADRGVVSP